MGIIKDSDVQQIWQSQNVDLKYTNSPIGTRALFIRIGKATYWIEYRKGEDGYTPGLAIYRTDPPPASSVVSPNASDAVEAPTQAVTSDVWLMNLDSFRYSSNTTVTGSPTLPNGKTFLDASGAVSISAVSKDLDTVSVTVTRRNDTVPPPTPVLSNPNFWQSPETELLTPGYQDADSVIEKYQLSLNDKITESPGSESNSWYPTYLS